MMDHEHEFFVAITKIMDYPTQRQRRVINVLSMILSPITGAFAFLFVASPVYPYQTSIFGNKRWPRQRTTISKLNMIPSNIEYINSGTDSVVTQTYGGGILLTSAIIKCAYDGTYFHGWTAGNSEIESNNNQRCDLSQNHDMNLNNQGLDERPKIRIQSRRSRILRRKGGGCQKHSGREVRTVDDTIRYTLAKIYGNVDAARIKIEACSRTDAGVHAQSLVAQFYCTKSESHPQKDTSSRPNSKDDASNFLPLPFGSDLSKLMFVLNRMLPPDVRIVAVSPLPCVPCATDARHYVAFHPTLHTQSKTYIYKFAIGSIHDPLQTHYVWHLDGSSARAMGMNGKRFNLERAVAAANLFVDSTDEACLSFDTAKRRDYGAFRSAFRGTDRGRIQSTICKLWKCDIVHERKEYLPTWENDSHLSSVTTNEQDDHNKHYGSRIRNPFSKKVLGAAGLLSDEPQTFTITITGDRFLYKMIRNIVGTIVAVGCGHVEMNDVRTALETGTWDGNPVDKAPQSRRICAPARGLLLAEVNYPEEVGFNWHTG